MNSLRCIIVCCFYFLSSFCLQAEVDSLSWHLYWQSNPYFTKEQKELILEASRNINNSVLPKHIYSGLSLLDVNHNYLSLQTSRLSSWSLKVLPLGKHKVLLSVITRVEAPIPDSQIQFYTSSWEQLPQSMFIKSPNLSDFEGSSLADLYKYLSTELYISYQYEADNILSAKLLPPIILRDDIREDLIKHIHSLPKVYYSWDNNAWKRKQH